MGSISWEAYHGEHIMESISCGSYHGEGISTYNIMLKRSGT